MNMFDYKSLLKGFLFNGNDFKKCKSSNVFLQLLHRLNFLSTMSEIVKQIQLFLSIPAASVANKRSMLKLNRIQSFLGCRMAQEMFFHWLLFLLRNRYFLIQNKPKRKELHDIQGIYYIYILCILNLCLSKVFIFYKNYAILFLM